MEKKKRNKLAFIFNVIGLSLTLISIVFLLYKDKQAENKINEVTTDYKKIKEIVANDSVSKIKEFIINEYIPTVREKNYEKYSTMFADTVERFFLVDKLTRKEVFYQMRWYWKNIPDAQVNYNIKSITVEKEKENYIVFIQSFKKNSGVESEIISELRLNKKKQIYYIRDFYALKDKKNK